MRAVFTSAVLAVVSISSAAAQQQACSVIDSVAVVGANRLASGTVVARAGIPTGELACYRDIQKAIERVYGTGQVSDVQVFETQLDGRQVLIIEIEERPMLARWSVQGPERVSERSVRGRVHLLEGRPYDPDAAARSRAGIDSLYAQEGYYFARVRLRELPQDDGSLAVAFDIDEGRRVALSQVIIEGNSRYDDGEIVGRMGTGPEGFWWWRKGEYNDDLMDLDIRERLPEFYGDRGFIDFAVTNDTLLVHEETGKGTLVLTVDEGQQYEVGSFDVVGNRHFSTEQLETLYPFGERSTGFLGLGGTRRGPVVFDQGTWREATDVVSQLYANNGYIYARVSGQEIRRAGDSDSTPKVDLRWQIAEGSPAWLGGHHNQKKRPSRR